ncbi:molecular chaperone [uncultured Stenotrophomonas sp.]|uniref:fimbrial biogenesis chaperone n=1 Tax=uncultured Stenotrophomonas sp. TaxID=165438 RepID=UPI0025E6DC26|nr:molecular chaperone [uncultured Stenotrophomonas sp.]
MDTDRESVFHFNLLDIPPKPSDASGRNLLQFEVRTGVKLFHRPASLPGNARDAAAQLQWHAEGNVLEVRNPSAYHVTLSTATLADGARWTWTRWHRAPRRDSRCRRAARCRPR